MAQWRASTWTFLLFSVVAATVVLVDLVATAECRPAGELPFGAQQTCPGEVAGAALAAWFVLLIVFLVYRMATVRTRAEMYRRRAASD